MWGGRPSIEGIEAEETERGMSMEASEGGTIWVVVGMGKTEKLEIETEDELEDGRDGNCDREADDDVRVVPGDELEEEEEDCVWEPVGIGRTWDEESDGGKVDRADNDTEDEGDEDEEWGVGLFWDMAKRSTTEGLRSAELWRSNRLTSTKNVGKFFSNFSGSEKSNQSLAPIMIPSHPDGVHDGLPKKKKKSINK